MGTNNNYDTWKQTYHATILDEIQQEMSILQGACEKGRIDGEFLFFDKALQADPTEITTLHGQTNWRNTDWERRSVAFRMWYDAPIYAEAEIEYMLTNPQSALTRNSKFGMKREVDRFIIQAFDADVKTGKNRDGNAVFPAGQIIDATGGMTYDVLREIKKQLDANDLIGNTQRNLVISPEQEYELLGVNQFISNDYVVDKPVAKGAIANVLGIDIFVSNLLGVDANSKRECFAWVNEAMVCAINKDITVKVGELADRHFDKYVYTNMWANAMRIHDEGVIKVLATE